MEKIVHLRSTHDDPRVAVLKCDMGVGHVRKDFRTHNCPTRLRRLRRSITKISPPTASACLTCRRSGFSANFSVRAPDLPRSRGSRGQCRSGDLRARTRRESGIYGLECPAGLVAWLVIASLELAAVGGEYRYASAMVRCCRPLAQYCWIPGAWRGIG